MQSSKKVVGHCRLLSTAIIRSSRSRPGAKEAYFAKRMEADRANDPKVIMEDEEKGVFRVLDIGNKRAGERAKDVSRDARHKLWKEDPVRRFNKMSPDQDWGSVWPAARTFHPAVVPLPVRQGVIQTKSQVVPSKYANAELMKIPNFLHLTPPVIQKHCAALRKFCTAWPKALSDEQTLEKHFPLEVITSDYLNTSSSIRDRRSRIICVKFKLSSLNLDAHAYDKFIRLVEDRYDEDTDIVTIVVDRCPYRGQNLDYARYLMTALYHESKTVEDWEMKQDADLEHFQFELTPMKETITRTIQEFDKLQRKVSGEDLEGHQAVLTDILNKGEDENSVHLYKSKAQKILQLKGPPVKPEVLDSSA